MKNPASALFICIIGILPISLFAQESAKPVIPRNYVCYQTAAPISIDGLINELNWQNASWSNYFVDIEGSLKPEPAYKTRMKMLWDTNFLYIAAEF